MKKERTICQTGGPRHATGRRERVRECQRSGRGVSGKKPQRNRELLSRILRWAALLGPYALAHAGCAEML